MSVEKKPAAAGPAAHGPAGAAPAAYPLDRYTVQSKAAEQQDSPYYKSQAPSIELPKGGGALKGIDEKFTVNAVNGTSSLEVPLPLSSGRGGFTPALGISYNSGGGNSEFGLGWSLSLPAIQRKTDKKLPRYQDATDSDIFLLAGAEDLVPELDAAGAPAPELQVGNLRIRSFRPRVEGLFARIEHIRDIAAGTSWWRVTTRDNITTWYGLTASSRLADPADPRRVFRWLPEIVCDHRGNVQQYFYVDEDLRGVAGLPERNRLAGIAPIANKYLKEVAYCNATPWFSADSDVYAPDLPDTTAGWMMQLVLDYGDHSAPQLFDADQPWDCRSDAFSDFHAGFEIRTYRRCRRVMMFHRIPEFNYGQPTLVRSLELQYEHDGSPAGTLTEADYITAILQHGHRLSAVNNYITKSLPPITLTHQPLRWDTTLHSVSPEAATNSPQGLTGPYQWTDLHGEGLPGILSEQAGGWFYKRNLGDGNFGRAEQVSPKPSLRGLGQSLQWQDLDADGRRQLVSRDRSLPGYFELNDDQQWRPFKPFPSNVNIDWNSPYTHLLDLDGDGRPDILMTRDTVWTWYHNEGTGGITSGGQNFAVLDEERGPRLLVDNRVQRIFLADMNGDGLTDLVRIDNGEICYWPNKGYGRFGAKVTMADAPRFDNPDDYNPQYLTLADISGTGAPDLIYLGNNRCTAWINLAGNGWSGAYEIAPLPGISASSRVAVLDFLGNGTGCIVWSSPLPQHARAPIRYMDLMGGVKPYLMLSYENGMGKKVSVDYRSSTGYYLDDEKAGRPWASKLPFPVQCVSEILTEDSVSETSYKQRYGYHHGYYDHEEREFRGFGRVDTIDTESAAYFQSPTPAGRQDLDQAPVLTLTWYHTGAWLRETPLLERYKEEYFRFEHWDAARVIADIPPGLSPQELREAHRALKGSALRQEVYALDGSGQEHIPYTVTASAYGVKRLQPMAGNRHAVFLSHQQESVTFSCERNPADPRISHQLNLAIDELGNVLKSAQVVYGRRHAPAHLPQLVRDEQETPHIVAGINAFSQDVRDAGQYRLRMPVAAASYELVPAPVFQPPAGTLWTPKGLKDALDAALAVDFLDTPTPGTKRLLSSTRSLYLGNDALTALAPGAIDTLGLPYEQYQLAFTDTFTAASGPYDGHVDAAKLAAGHYIRLNGESGCWIPSGTAEYIDTDPTVNHTNPAAGFYTPVMFVDPFGNKTKVQYRYWMLPERVTDAAGNVSEVNAWDWRLLQPTEMTDLNDNVSQIAYDTLGMPLAMAVEGKVQRQPDGTRITQADNLDLLDQEGSIAQNLFWTDPDMYAGMLLGNATMRCVYDLSASPVAVAMIGREWHAVDDPASPVLIRISYTDGFGRVAMHKVQATDDGYGAQRWTGSGKTVYNNKGKAVLRYEPYFSPTHAYDPALQAASGGVSPRMHYDPLGRAWKTEMPDGTISHMTWDSWSQTAYDPIDALGSWYGPPGIGRFVSRSLWYDQRIILPSGHEERDAAEKAAVHADTPSRVHLDSLGRPFYTVQHNRSPDGAGGWDDQFIHTWETLDITGNRLEVTDGRGLRPLCYRYNLLKAPVFQRSIDGGDNYTLLDITGQPIYSRDAQGNEFAFTYDALRRPLEHWGGGRKLGMTVYGENVANDKTLNLRGQVLASYDGGGKHFVEEYDFKGMPRRSYMRLLADATTADADWNVLGGNALVSDETLFTELVVDALGRPFTSDSGRILGTGATTTTEHNLSRYSYGKDGALFQLRAGPDAYVHGIVHNARGQREAIYYDNGTKTQYSYDPLSQRLTRMWTTRYSDNKQVQNLLYFYDPAGNITRIKDGSQETVWFANRQVLPGNDYTYDALYRLVKAEGREQKPSGSPFSPGDDRSDTLNAFSAGLSWDGSMTALQRYTQLYQYDEVGNMVQLRHSAAAGGYTRDYNYSSASNRLLSTQIGGGTPYVHSHDVRGNMTKLPHLPVMDYDLSNQLRHVTAGTVQAYYQYSGGERVRKWVDKGNGVTEERIYYGAYEVYRKWSGALVQVERTTLHVSDDTGRIAMIEQRTIGTAATDNGTDAVLKRFIYGNHLQSAGLELDGTGEIISYEEYHPYGTTAYQANNAAIKAVAKRYRFTGKERDDETGLNYHSARYYIPWLCRWAAVDPLESEYAGWSAYQYCTCSPVNHTDSTGNGNDDENKWHPPMSGTTSELTLDGGLPSMKANDGGFSDGRGSSLHPIELEGVSANAWPGWNTELFSGEQNQILDAAIGDDGHIYRGSQEEIDKRIRYAAFKREGDELDNIRSGGVATSAAYTAVNVFGADKEWIPLGVGLDGVAEAFSSMEAITGKGPLLTRKGGNPPDITRNSKTSVIMDEPGNFIIIYRGTRRTTEMRTFQETGIMMSDAAIEGYVESPNVGLRKHLDAYIASEKAHRAQVSFWGSEAAYVEAHGMFGTEINEIGPKSMMSFTTDYAVAKKFSKGGLVVGTLVSKNNILPQTLITSNESEVLVRHMLFPWIK